MNALAPFRDTPSDPWDAEKAAHLARRAGFGAEREEREELVALGVEKAVERFVGFADEDAALEAELAAAGGELDDAREAQGAYGGAVSDRVRRRWFYRMVHGRQPLQEKLALFWHDHFACQESKVVRARLVAKQNELFRRGAAGSFRDLLRAVARDPAMLVFLDNRLSEAAKPNENWARELLELFTLGVDRYAQRDVTELARVFTGWTTPRPDSDEFRFDPALHDARDKTVFGATIRGRAGPGGVEEGDEALELILARPDCARFLAAKLLGWFASPAPAPAVEAELAEVLRRADWSIREALATLLRSAWFYAPEQRLALYKSPVELIVGAARALALQNAHQAGLERHGLAMGMELFEPPSVAGWEHGAGWAGAGSVAPRFALAIELSELPHAGRRITGRATVDFDRLAPRVDDARALVRALAERLLPCPLSAEQEQAAAECVAAGDPGQSGRGRVRAGVQLVLSAPQLALA